MTSTFGRHALTALGLAASTLLFVLALCGRAQAASIRFIAESDTPFERRLTAEIESVGFEVERPQSPDSPLPETTAAIVHVRSDPPQVELWLLGDTGKFELSSVVRDDARSEDDNDTSALRIAERLRALLQPVYVQARAAEAAAKSQASGQPAPRLAAPAQPLAPAPAQAPVLLPADRSHAAPASRPEQQQFNAAIGVGLGQHTNDVIPQATLELDYALLRGLGLGMLAVLPLRKASIQAGSDRAELEAWMAGVHGYARVTPLNPVELQLGAGVLGAYVRAQGAADSPRFGRSVSGLRWVPFLEGAGVYRLSPDWFVRAAGLIGLGLPDTPIEFAGETVAEWGKPYILTQLGLGYAW